MITPDAMIPFVFPLLLVAALGAITYELKDRRSRKLQYEGQDCDNYEAIGPYLIQEEFDDFFKIETNPIYVSKLKCKVQDIGGKRYVVCYNFKSKQK